MLQNDKLYIVVLKELLPGQKLAQSVHCAFSFAQEHNDLTSQWMSISNYICVLEIEEDKLNQFKIRTAFKF